MNRRERLKWLCTNRGMREAARRQKLRRGSGNDHLYIVGQFYLLGGRVVLRAVRCGAAFEIPRPPEFTDDARRFNRWRTRQAAHQFAMRWAIPEFHVLNLSFLDVLPGSLTAGKRAGDRPSLPANAAEFR